MSLKVHQIAKELSITSKLLVDYLVNVEGIPSTVIKDHNSSVSAGLEATIREWDADGKLDRLKEESKHAPSKSHKKKPSAKKAADASGSGEEDANATTAVVDAPDSASVDESEALSAPAVEEAVPAEVEAPVVPEAPVEAPEPVAAPVPVEVNPAAPAVPVVPAEPVAPVPEAPAVVAPVIEKPAEPVAPVAPKKPEVPVAPVKPAAVSAPAAPAPVAAEKEHKDHKGGGSAPVAPAHPVKPVAPVRPAAEVPQKPVRPPVSPRGIPNVPNRPSSVAPVGPMVRPAPAQLQGPRVVRVEQPDNLPAPRPRAGGPGGGGSRGGAGSGMNRGPGIPMPAMPTAGSTTGRVRSKGSEAPIIDDDELEKKKAKARGSRRGGGRSADAGADLIKEWREADLADRAERLQQAEGLLKERRREMHKTQQHRPNAPAQRPTKVEITPPVTVRELSEAMGIKSSELLKKLMGQGVMATVNQALDIEAAQMLGLEYGVEVAIKKKVSAMELAQMVYAEKETAAEKSPRPPVVTILGHVDHGKTSLLDKIRSANVAAGEAGGITQHVGAYTVEVEGSDGKRKRVTFLDTPGHQAFTAMRARGANMTDVVVLVVAADDGVMPQTIESINHAKAANVPIVVAMNKIDKPEANPNKVLGQLAEHGLNPAEWGGDVEVVRTSAVTGQGVKELIEYLDYVAALRDLKASPQLPPRGAVVEAFMDANRGVVARVLVQNGTLKIGDVIVCGSGYGRVRSITDDKGVMIQQAGPTSPVEVIGLDEVPDAGDTFLAIDNLSDAKSISDEQKQAVRNGEIAKRSKVTLDNLYDTIQAGDVKELCMILKADVQGSVDVLKQMMTEELSKEVKVKLLHAAVGGISESDVLLADASGAIIVGFSVVPDEAARKLAEDRKVEIRTYRIIYEITEDIRKALTGMLSPQKQDQVLGHVEIRQIFKVSKIGNIAGCMVTDGVIQRANKYRLIRDGAVVTENLELDSLKRQKEDVKEVRGGMECGLKIAGYDDIKVGDRLEAYKTVDVARSL